MLCRSSLARTRLKVMRLVLALPPRLTPQCPCRVQRVSSSPGAAVTVSLTVLWFSDQLPLIRWGPARCRSSSPHFPGMGNEYIGVARDATWTASSSLVWPRLGSPGCSRHKWPGVNTEVSICLLLSKLLSRSELPGSKLRKRSGFYFWRRHGEHFGLLVAPEISAAVPVWSELDIIPALDIKETTYFSRAETAIRVMELEIA